MAPTRPYQGLGGPVNPRRASRASALRGRPGLRALNRGLGAGSAAGQQVGASLLAIAPATGPAAPFVAAAGAEIALISSFIGGGCGQACIESSQAEQIYEYAGQYLDAVAKAGMLGQADLVNALQALLQGGTQHMQQLGQQDPQAQKGLANMTKALQMDLSYAATLPATAPNPLDMTKVQTMAPGTSRWYADSAAAGSQLALQYLSSLASAQSGGLSVNPATGNVSVLGATFSPTTLLVGLGALGLALYFFL